MSYDFEGGIPVTNQTNNVEYVYTDQLIPYENNAKLHKANVTLIANSIKQFGFRQPILVDKNNVIIAGHGRLLAAKQLKLREVPIIVAYDLTETQVRALRLADNKVSEGAYNDELLQQELDDLLTSDYDMADFGFMDFEEEAEDEEEKYTMKVDIPQYQMKGEQPEIEDLVNREKAVTLVNRIREADVPDDIAIFLKLAAQRHLVFDYAKIAEYYAHATPEVQELFEDSALVIIDFEDAIKNGYTTLDSQLGALLEVDSINDEGE